jgi:hypothetical protein
VILKGFCKVLEVLDSTMMNLVPKLAIKKNNTSYKRRSITLSPKDVTNGFKYYQIYNNLAELIDFDKYYGLNTDPTLLQLEADYFGKYLDAFYYPEQEYKKLKRGTRIKACLTIGDALQHCGPDSYVSFEKKFGFKVREMEKLVPLLFEDEEIDFSRGKIGREELFLIVCARLRHELSTVTLIGEFFGRDASFISDAFHTGIQMINQKFYCLLDLNNISIWYAP